MIIGKSSGPKCPQMVVGFGDEVRLCSLALVFELPLREVEEDRVLIIQGVSHGFGDDGFTVLGGNDLLGQLK